MNVALRRATTMAEFLTWEERQPVKYEFDGTEPRAMVGVTIEHSAIQMNLLAALATRLHGKACRPHGSDVKIRAAGAIRYPDAMVVCTLMPRGTTVVTEPVVVFEILSPSSEHHDLVVKNAEYRETPSIQHYVVLEQAQIGALVFTRSGESWVSEALGGEEAVLRLPAIEVEIRLGELYAGLALEPYLDEDDQPP